MKLYRPCRAYKKIPNMVALPHYPMLCRPFRTYLPRNAEEVCNRGEGCFYTFSRAWHSVFNCWWWSEPNHTSESVLCPLYHRYRERIRSELEAEEKRSWDLSSNSFRGLWLESVTCILNSSLCVLHLTWCKGTKIFFHSQIFFGISHVNYS